MKISAPDKDGYTFFCWLSLTSNGRIKLVYTNNSSLQLFEQINIA